MDPNKAWKQCYYFRIIAMIFETLLTVNAILWYWFPIEGWNSQIFQRLWRSQLTGGLIIVLGGIIMLKGMKDAGSESAKPSQETEMYGGIYNYIRHPQSLGEFPIFPALGLMVNSMILFIILTAYIIIYLPIMIHYEEQDLLKRFGDPYLEYKEGTGALFPKWDTIRNWFGLKK